MHIKFHFNQIISMEVLYNNNQNMVLRIMRLKYDTCSKQHKKNSVSTFNELSLDHTNIHPVLHRIEILPSLSSFTLICHDSDLDLSALYASLTLMINNFLYSQNLTKTL